MTEPQPPVYAPDPGRSAPQPRRRSSFLSWLMEVVVVLVLALALSAVLRHFVLQVYSIPSESMMNTLQVGDRILVNRLPVIGKDVERGDVIVFQDQENWMADLPEAEIPALRAAGEFLGLLPTDGKQVIVKRVIGVGGDEVSCDGNGEPIKVNGQAIDEPYIAPWAVPATEEFSIVVPEGHYWVMGDNRQNSADSLHHLAEGTEFIEDDAVIGRVQWVVWPFAHWSTVPHREAFADVPDPS